MKIKSYLLLFALTFAVSSCDFFLKRKYLSFKWNFTDQNFLVENGEKYNLSLGGISKNACLRLFDNETFTIFIKDNYKHGTWEYADNQLFLNASDNKNILAKIKHFSPNRMVIEIKDFDFPETSADKPKGIFQFALLKEIYEIDEKYDPYRPELNEWRIKATKKESWQEIGKRAKNHLEYLIGFHEFALQKKGGSISFNEIPTLFQFLKNGIFVHKEESDDEYFNRWEATFFDDDDATKCRKLLKKTMYKTKIRKDIPDTLPFNLDILKQMHTNLDKALEEIQ